MVIRSAVIQHATCQFRHREPGAPEATSWCVNTYLSHLDRAFSLGADTWMALGMTGCKTVPKSRLEAGLWSTHFSPPADLERRCNGRTGVAVYTQQEMQQPTDKELVVLGTGLAGHGLVSTSSTLVTLSGCGCDPDSGSGSVWAFRSMQLDGGAADHLNAALLIFSAQRTYTAVHLFELSLLLKSHDVFKTGRQQPMKAQDDRHVFPPALRAFYGNNKKCLAQSNHENKCKQQPGFILFEDKDRYYEFNVYWTLSQRIS
ncbi:hypothetical protein INR49_010855 [Caranx melampygus]|nr:hypothetical protein INR49_010855 [Caranx melampygus]